MSTLKTPYFDKELQGLEGFSPEEHSQSRQFNSPFFTTELVAEDEFEEEWQEDWDEESEMEEDWEEEEFDIEIEIDSFFEEDEYESEFLDNEDDFQEEMEIEEEQGVEYTDYEGEREQGIDYELVGSDEDSFEEFEGYLQRTDSQNDYEEEYKILDYEKEDVKNGQSLINNIVKIAREEYDKWHKDGKELKETQVNARAHLENYWRSVVNVKGINWRIKQRRPWSAAFVSYVIDKAGGSPPFKKGRAHVIYARDAKRNLTKKRYKGPVFVWFYKIEEVKPRVGDILFNGRVVYTKNVNGERIIDRNRVGVNFGNVGNGKDWATHSDIILDVDEVKGYVQVIGGNVGQSVGIRKRLLDENGHIKLKGIKLKEYFGILRFRSFKESQSIISHKNSNSKSFSNIALLLGKIGLGIYDFGRFSLRLFEAISNGQKENELTDIVFYYRFPSQRNKKIKKGSNSAREWNKIRNLFIRPLLQKQDIFDKPLNEPSNSIQPQQTTTTNINGTDLEGIPSDLGRIVVNENITSLYRNARSSVYKFTPTDAIWMARLAMGENHTNGVGELWTMINRFVVVNRWSSFEELLRKYSTTLQKFIKNKKLRARFNSNTLKDANEYMRVKGGIQRRRHVELQQKEWKNIPIAVRTLVIAVLRGERPNPEIGIATHFASTRIYYKRNNNKANPSRDQWLRFTKRYAENKKRVKNKNGKIEIKERAKWEWIGPRAHLKQMQKNAFFIQMRFKKIPGDYIQIRM